MKNITVAGKSYEVYWFTGKVASAKKSHTTQVHGGGGGGVTYQGTGSTAPVHITSTTTTHDELFLVSSSGEEKSFQLTDFNLACRESNDVSIIWAMPSGSKQGPYVGVLNHTTKDGTFKPKAIKDLVNPSGCLYPALGLGSLVISGGLGSFGVVTAIIGIGLLCYSGWLSFVVAEQRVSEFKNALKEINFRE